MGLTKDIGIPCLKLLTKTSEAWQEHRLYRKYIIYIEMMRRDSQILEYTVIKCWSESFQNLLECQCLLKCCYTCTIFSKMMEGLNTSCCAFGNHEFLENIPLLSKKWSSVLGNSSGKNISLGAMGTICGIPATQKPGAEMGKNTPGCRQLWGGHCGNLV